jgi:hypothetical protein
VIGLGQIQKIVSGMSARPPSETDFSTLRTHRRSDIGCCHDGTGKLPVDHQMAKSVDPMRFGAA